jgi:peptidoglycan/LPS O-acetylase OafA/YrhL
MTSRTVHYVEGLDPLRAFAALSVLAFHAMGVNL